jgi:hypothetical protein
MLLVQVSGAPTRMAQLTAGSLNATILNHSSAMIQLHAQKITNV